MMDFIAACWIYGQEYASLSAFSCLLIRTRRAVAGLLRINEFIETSISISLQVLDLPTQLLTSQFCQPLVLRAHERLLSAYADLEAAWSCPVGVVTVQAL